jgi:predicted aspartyl protease
MRRLPVLALLAAALLVSGACAPKRAFTARRAPRPSPLEGRVVEVPVSVAQGVVLVPTLVDGKGPFWFAFDTGATTVVVDERVAEIADLRVEDRRGSIVTEAGRSDGTVRQSILRELRIGSAGFRSTTALVADLQSISRGVGRTVDGILGVPLLRPHVWTIDSEAGWLRIEDGEIPADATDVIPLVMDDDLPAMRIDVAGRPMTAIVDTGQRMALSIGPDDAAPMRSSLRPIGESVGQVLDGEVRRPVARLDGDVSVAPGIVLRAPPVLLGRATRVGMEAFGDRILAFDLKNLRMRAAARDGR